MGYLSILGSTGTTTTPTTTTTNYNYSLPLSLRSRGPLRPFGFASLRQPDAYGTGAFRLCGRNSPFPLPIPQSPHNPTAKNSAKTPKIITYLKKYKKVSVCPCKAGSKSDILCTCSPDMVKHEGLSERIFEISMFEKTVNVCVRGQ